MSSVVHLHPLVDLADLSGIYFGFRNYRSPGG